MTGGAVVANPTKAAREFKRKMLGAQEEDARNPNGRHNSFINKSIYDERNWGYKHSSDKAQ